jgi:hypothetical protein
MFILLMDCDITSVRARGMLFAKREYWLAVWLRGWCRRRVEKDWDVDQRGRRLGTPEVKVDVPYFVVRFGSGLHCGEG